MKHAKKAGSLLHTQTENKLTVYHVIQIVDLLDKGFIYFNMLKEHVQKN
jgi:hypothetical protein